MEKMVSVSGVVGNRCVLASMQESLQNKGKVSVGVIPLTGPLHKERAHSCSRNAPNC
jgi:hypothetical protein